MSQIAESELCKPSKPRGESKREYIRQFRLFSTDTGRLTGDLRQLSASLYMTALFKMLLDLIDRPAPSQGGLSELDRNLWHLYRARDFKPIAEQLVPEAERWCKEVLAGHKNLPVGFCRREFEELKAIASLEMCRVVMERLPIVTLNDGQHVKLYVREFVEGKVNQAIDEICVSQVKSATRKKRLQRSQPGTDESGLYASEAVVFVPLPADDGLLRNSERLESEGFAILRKKLARAVCKQAVDVAPVWLRPAVQLLADGAELDYVSRVHLGIDSLSLLEQLRSLKPAILDSLPPLKSELALQIYPDEPDLLKKTSNTSHQPQVVDEFVPLLTTGPETSFGRSGPPRTETPDPIAERLATQLPAECVLRSQDGTILKWRLSSAAVACLQLRHGLKPRPAA